MSSVGGVGGAPRPDGLEPSDPAKVDQLVTELQGQRGSGPGWLAFLDADSSTRKLAETLLRDGKFDGEDAKKLVRDAKDYQKITSSEKQVFAGLLRDHAAKITPEARDALAKFFNLPIGRPQIFTPAYPGEMRVTPGPSDYSLDDDTLVMSGTGKFESKLNRDIYTAGYLPRDTGPMFKPMGTKAESSSVLDAADNKINTEKSPVERFDEMMKRATGSAGGAAARYAKDGKQPEAEPWWGYCDRWAYQALDPEIATRVNEPVYHNGVYLSTAELRGLATYLGKYDMQGSLFDKSVSALDLQKASTLFVKENGPGFVADVWNDEAKKKNEVWNQPFDAVKQNVKELSGAEAEKILKDEFKLRGRDLEGKRVFYVETEGVYGLEAGEEHEGPATHGSKKWKSWIVAGPDGKAVDGKYAPGSDDPLEYIWRPPADRTLRLDPEAKFFRDMLKAAVPAKKVKDFERELGGLPQSPVAAGKKAELVAKYKGVAAGFPDAALAAKLRPLGLAPADFR